MQKWDYKRIERCTDEALEELGNHGWELVGIDGFSSTVTSFYIFKRPQEDTPATQLQQNLSNYSDKNSGKSAMDEPDWEQLR